MMVRRNSLVYIDAGQMSPTASQPPSQALRNMIFANHYASRIAHAFIQTPGTTLFFAPSLGGCEIESGCAAAEQRVNFQ